MTSDYALTLSTALKPAKKFLVIRKDGVEEEYQLLGVDHLSPTDEAKTMALFARYNWLNTELDATPKTDKGEKIAAAMRSVRLNLIAKMTDMPAHVADEMPLTQQVKLLEAIQVEIEGEDESDTVTPEDDPVEKDITGVEPDEF